jgi:hypothetical protein
MDTIEKKKKTRVSKYVSNNAYSSINPSNTFFETPALGKGKGGGGVSVLLC